MKRKKVSRKNPAKILSDTLYCYVQKSNAAHARRIGLELFGSYSNYINALIAKDRGVKPRLGKWTPEFQKTK